MYKLRSGILHGSDLMQLDQDLAFGFDPSDFNENELQKGALEYHAHCASQLAEESAEQLAPL